MCHVAVMPRQGKAAIRSQPILIGTDQRVLELHAVKDTGSGLRVYVKDGTHRQSTVRVAAAATDRIADLCDQLGIREMDLELGFKRSLVEGTSAAELASISHLHP